MKAMLADIEKRMPGRKDVMIRALGNINASHMLDTKLFDFAGLAPTGEESADGDKAFDPETFREPAFADPGAGVE